jgi:nucleoside-diphosphate kinase
MTECDCYSFDAEWHDPQADLARPYTLFIFNPKGIKGPLELQIWDPKSNRTFLKRAPLDSLRMEDLFVGSTLNIHSRQMKLVGYGDENTKRALEGNCDAVALLTSPSAFSQLPAVLSCIEGAGLVISRLRLVSDGGPVVAIQVTGSSAEAAWEIASVKLKPGLCNKVSMEQAMPYFEDLTRYPTTAVFHSCTLCLMRPHILKDGRSGEVLSAIMKAGFEVSAMKLVHLTKPEAAEFLDVYKGVLPHYPTILDSMVTTPSLALELRKDNDVVSAFRDLCGPHDVEIAKQLRPSTLRARFGVDNARNAVHCTDLPEDGELECRYIFELIN